MAVTGKCVLVVEAPLDEAFAKFIDFPGWKDWMPEIFTPLSGPEGPLQGGSKFRVRLKARGPALPLSVKVLRLHPGREIAWGGGLPGLLRGEHSFFFEDAGEGRTRIRSEETFSGLLTAPKPLARMMKKEIERIGEAQLGAFGGWIKRSQAA